MSMKKQLSILIVSLFLFISVMLFVPNIAKADWVNGYYRNDGTYVNGYYRSRPNAYTYDNYSYTGPTESNGYGYNDSYYSNDSYSSEWYTPSNYDYNWGYEDSWSDYNSGRDTYYYWEE